MNSQWVRLCAAVTLTATAMLRFTPSIAQSGKSCSYEAINGSCNLTIDRLNAVAPPTIYVRHGKTVTVVVSSSLPFEHLTMDLKASAAQVPQDQLANGFTALTTVLGGLTILETSAGPAARVAGAPAPAPGSAHDILDRQSKMEAEAEHAIGEKNGVLTIWATSVLTPINNFFQPLTSAAVAPRQPPPDWNSLKGPFDTGAEALTSLDADDFKKRLGQLDVDIADAADKKAASAGQLTIMAANQKNLQTALERFTTLKQKLTALKEIVDGPLVPGPNSFVISDLQSNDQNNIVQTWDLNAANSLATVAGKVKQDKYPDKITAALSGLTDVPAKQVVAEFKIQFMNAPRFEISSGLLVPIKPYHAYSVGLSLASATTPPGATPSCPPNDCAVVQQTLTNAVVPEVSVNFPLMEFTPHKQRLAIMASVAAGYNTATTSAAFGFGPSVAWRSLVISPLAVASRDQELTGGYVLGQSAGTATTPMTTNVWTFNPSIGISLRIPLGGASK